MESEEAQGAWKIEFDTQSPVPSIRLLVRFGFSCFSFPRSSVGTHDGRSSVPCRGLSSCQAVGKEHKRR